MRVTGQEAAARLGGTTEARRAWLEALPYPPPLSAAYWAEHEQINEIRTGCGSHGSDGGCSDEEPRLPLVQSQQVFLGK
ncbi:hypothetical protein MRX96_030663 [Rhipicephalus microplus]